MVFLMHMGKYFRIDVKLLANVRHLGAPRGLSGALWASLGLLGASWGPLGASWVPLGDLLGTSWGLLGPLGASWGRLGAVLGSS